MIVASAAVLTGSFLTFAIWQAASGSRAALQPRLAAAPARQRQPRDARPPVD